MDIIVFNIIYSLINIALLSLFELFLKKLSTNNILEHTI